MIKNKFFKKRIRAGRINKLNIILENSAKIIPKKSAIAGFETFIPIFWRNDRYYIQNKIVPILMPPSLIWVLWSKTVPQHYLLHTTCWQKSTPTAYLAEDRCCDSVTGASHCTKYSCCRCIPLSTWCWSCPSCSLWPWCHNTHWSLCHAGTSSCSFIVLGRKSASSCIVVIQIQSSSQNSCILSSISCSNPAWTPPPEPSTWGVLPCAWRPPTYPLYPLSIMWGTVLFTDNFTTLISISFLVTS